MTGQKELFQAQKPHEVLMYVCGITPYDRSHLGHGRSAVVFDLLYRWLCFLGNDVTYIRNITDIDDKILIKAREQYGDYAAYNKVAQYFIDQYHEELKKLNCLPPTKEPRVTEHIPLIIDFIKDLIEKGYAYQSNGDVYFSIKKFPSYAKLSRQKIEDLHAGARIEIDERKHDPLDFALWKSEAEGSFWQSPWGWGRPGWHIECSTLARHYLGDTIDIHGGGRDLIFPHHENEIAQSESLTNKNFAAYWVHNGLIRLAKEKMSKSLGNVLTLEDLLKEHDPMVLRYYFLTHHYQAPFDFSFQDLQAAEKSYKRLCIIFIDTPSSDLDAEALKKIPIIKQMMSFLSDDLNTPGMLGVLFENLDTLKKDSTQRAAVKQFLQNVLGLIFKEQAVKETEITPEIKQMIEEREVARAEKNWQKADMLREKLRTLGYEVQDKRIK